MAVGSLGRVWRARTASIGFEGLEHWPAHMGLGLGLGWLGPAALGEAGQPLSGPYEPLQVSITLLWSPVVLEAAPSLGSCARGTHGAGGLPKESACSPSSGCWSSFVPRMLSRMAGLQGPAEEQRCWQPEPCCHTGSSGGLFLPAPLIPGARRVLGKDLEALGEWPRLPSRQRDRALLLSVLLPGGLPLAGVPGAGCWLCGGRFPGEGRLRSWLGNVGVSGQGGPGPARAAGGLFLLASGFQQELRQQQPARWPYSQGSS